MFSLGQLWPRLHWMFNLEVEDSSNWLTLTLSNSLLCKHYYASNLLLGLNYSMLLSRSTSSEEIPSKLECTLSYSSIYSHVCSTYLMQSSSVMKSKSSWDNLPIRERITFNWSFGCWSTFLGESGKQLLPSNNLELQ